MGSQQNCVCEQDRKRKEDSTGAAQLFLSHRVYEYYGWESQTTITKTYW